MNKFTEEIYWFDDNHRAWSSDGTVRAHVQAYQKQRDKGGAYLGIAGLVLTVVCTVWSGDAWNFFGFLILFAGAIMLIGQARGE